MTDKLDFNVFDENQRQVLLGLQKDFDKMVEKKVEERIQSLNGVDEDIVNFDQKTVKRHRQLRTMSDIWRNNGFVDGCSKQITYQDLAKKDMELKDSLSSTDQPLLIPRVIEQFAREAVEPNLVLTPLYQRINHQNGTYVVFPSWGAIHAADIAEGEEYPERSLEMAGTVTATIGKSGVAIKLTEETIRYSMFDVMAMHFRAAGRALARHKEKKIANKIVSDGTVLMDGLDTSYRSPTGRNVAGALNGTLTLDDLFYCYAQMVNTGFTPNCLIFHPFAWKIFAEEGIARAFGFTNGMNPLMWQLAQGQPGNAPGFAGGGGGLNNNRYVSQPQQLATTFTNVPSIFPTNFQIIVSPYMPYDTTTVSGKTLTTIAFCDSGEMGVLVVDEDITTEEWNDPARDIMKVKFRERYSLATLNEGKSIGLLKNISIDKSYDFDDKIRVSYGTGDLVNPITGNIGYVGDGWTGSA